MYSEFQNCSDMIQNDTKWFSSESVSFDNGV